jgi:hypothetical protein
VGPRDVLDAVVKRKIPSPRRESNLRTPIVQQVKIIVALHFIMPELTVGVNSFFLLILKRQVLYYR